MSDDKTLFNQPPAGQVMVYIGIDPGHVNGLAVYSKERGLRVYQLSFWKMLDYLNGKVLPAVKEGRIVVKAIVEANHRNHFVYSRTINKGNKGTVLTMARNAGMNQGYCKLICEWFVHNGIEVEEMVPTGRDLKWSVHYFTQLSNIETSESQEHCRDAARFISRFWLGKLNDIKA